MAEDEGSLVMRRSKRSTAGNRMEAALAEFRAEDVGMDVEDDVDFIVEKDEEDAFESDFESTDEEAQTQEELNNQEERRIWDDERHARQANRSKLDRVTAAAHARNKASFNPQIHEMSFPDPSSSRLKRRVSTGSAVDADTSGAAEGNKRQSRRAHTMQNTSETAIRIKDAEEKKSALPKRTKTPVKLPSQRELIERALKMEEGNIKEHREYLTTEEEKRKKARLVRTTVQGPLVRWVSRVEEETVREEPPRPPTPSFTYTAVPYHQYYPPPPPPPPLASTPAATSSSSRSFLHVSASYHAELPQTKSTFPSTSQPYPTPPAKGLSEESSTPPPSQPSVPSSTSSWQPAFPVASQNGSSTTTSQPSLAPYTQPYYSHPYYYYQHYTPPQPPPAPPDPIERIEKVAKNYVIHELSQEEKQRPPWYSTMSAMFGDHVKWEELRVYTSKGRPLSRPVLPCPITGRTAKYRDPRTNVPFADVAAYETLSKILEHEYVWSDSLGCYTS